MHRSSVPPLKRVALAVLVLFVAPNAFAAEGPAQSSLAIGRASVPVYSTYFGGSGMTDSINGASVDAGGNLYITGVADGTIPVTEGALQAEYAGQTDAFVAKLDPAGRLLWATYLGGSHSDTGSDVAVASDGSVYVVGTTLSEDLPVTPGAVQQDFKGTTVGCEFLCSGDAFVARLAADGSQLEYSTFLGGTIGEAGNSIEVSSTGEAIVTGWTTSPDFPTSTGAFDTSYNEPTCFDQCDADVFVARLNPAGAQLQSSTFFGGTSWDSAADLAVDGDGNVYIAGSTRSIDIPTTETAFQSEKNGNGDFDFSGFVAALDQDLAVARYVTYFGGREEDHVSGLAVTESGEAWIAGFGGSGVATTADALQRERRGPSDAFVSGFSVDGSSLVYSTRFGGSREDYGRGVAIDARGRVYLSGSTASPDLRVRRAFQPSSGGFDDLFFVRFRPGAARAQQATYVGGERFEAATDLVVTDGAAYLVGSSESRAFPLAGRFAQSNRAGNDGVVTRIDNGRLIHVKVDDVGFWQPRVRMNLGRTLVWHFANTSERSNRLVELRADLFDTTARRPGTEYFFTFPAGRFTIEHARSGRPQRVALAPGAVYGEAPGTVEVRWARFPLGSDIAFDVQVKIGSGNWRSWLTDTSEIGGVYDGGPANYRFRARVKNLGTLQTSGWSPPALLSEPD